MGFQTLILTIGLIQIEDCYKMYIRFNFNSKVIDKIKEGGQSSFPVFCCWR